MYYAEGREVPSVDHAVICAGSAALLTNEGSGRSVGESEQQNFEAF